MQPLRHIKNRIRVIGNTHKITDAMERISVTKLKRMESTLSAIRPYVLQIDSLLHDLTCNIKVIRSPFFQSRPGKGKIGLCVITSDSGLCGLYNSNVIRLADEFIRQHGKEKIKLVLIGRKGFAYFKNRGIEILKTYTGLQGKYQKTIFDEIGDYLSSIFLSGEVDEVYTAHTHYQTALILKPVLNKFLNLEQNYNEKTGIEFILEPDAQRILGELIPRYISLNFRRILLEAFTSEHSARTVSMKMATDNAEELLKMLVLLRNKVRQANITQEMMEIIASSEALKG